MTTAATSAQTLGPSRPPPGAAPHCRIPAIAAGMGLFATASLFAAKTAACDRGPDEALLIMYMAAAAARGSL